MAESSGVEGVVTVTVQYNDGSRLEFDIPEGAELFMSLHTLDKYAYTRRLYDKDGNEQEAL